MPALKTVHTEPSEPLAIEYIVVGKSNEEASERSGFIIKTVFASVQYIFPSSSTERNEKTKFSFPKKRVPLSVEVVVSDILS